MPMLPASVVPVLTHRIKSTRLPFDPAAKFKLVSPVVPVIAVLAVSAEAPITDTDPICGTAGKIGDVFPDMIKILRRTVR